MTCRAYRRARKQIWALLIFLVLWVGFDACFVQPVPDYIFTVLPLIIIGIAIPGILMDANLFFLALVAKKPRQETVADAASYQPEQEGQ